MHVRFKIYSRLFALLGMIEIGLGIFLFPKTSWQAAFMIVFGISSLVISSLIWLAVSFGIVKQTSQIDESDATKETYVKTNQGDGL